MVVGAVEAHANSAAFGGIGGSVLVYLGSFALFGLIGLVPLLADKAPAATPATQWTLVGKPDRQLESVARQIGAAGMTIDGEFTVLEEPRLLPGEDPRWGR